MEQLQLSKRNRYYTPKKLFYADADSLEQFLTNGSDIHYVEIVGQEYYQKREPEKGNRSTKIIPDSELYNLFIEEGNSIQSIATMYGVGRMTIFKKLRALGYLELKKSQLEGA